MTDYTTIILDVVDEVATITFNRPQSMNSLNRQMVEELLNALGVVRNDSTVKTVILTGAGRSFSAGGDIDYLSSLTDILKARDFIMSAGKIVSEIMAMEKPVIAMVNGVAAGAGFNIALACDIVFCADNARFGQSFSKVGLIPDCGGLYLLPRVVGLHKAKELMFSAELISAETAFVLGVVNKVIPSDNLKAVTYDYATQLAHAAPISLSFIKSMINRSGDLNLESTLESEADLQALCMQTEDHKEGIAAFKEKRPAVFKGK